MLSAEQNELVTRVGPDTGAGAVLRRYWQPAALSEELTGGRPVVPVRLLGEELVAFRDGRGRCGLIGRHCAHRGVDLAYGRLEADGLRCPFHGWLYDVAGQCIEQPAEPAGSTFHTKVRHPGYTCVEANGIVFAWLGPGAPPALPAIDGLAAPDSHTFAFKGFVDANWLQLLEVGIDPAHASFLHRFLVGDEAAYGQQFRDTAAGSDMPVTRVMREYDCPTLELEETAYGLRIMALRDLGDAGMHVRVTNLLFPNAIVIPLSNDMVLTQWHVPIDDERSWWYAIFHAFNAPVDKATMRADRLELYTLPDYRSRQSRANAWGYDAAEQRTRTYTGMGDDINVHDNWAVESPGAIFDRRREQLGTTDVAITTNRRLLLGAIQALEQGSAPALAQSGSAGGGGGPAAIDTVEEAADWRAGWQVRERERRARSAWAGEL